VTFYGPRDLDLWADELERHAELLADRYDSLTERDLREAAPGDPRWLIVADEVQKGTRAKKIGKRIKDALSIIAEQSASLGDVLILSSQREPNSIPPPVRENSNARLRMLGNGYFFYQADGHPTQSGRTALLGPAEVLAALNDPPSTATSQPSNLQPPTTDHYPLTTDNLPTLLGAHSINATKAPATLYLGTPGAGKTHALHHHPCPEPSRGANGSAQRHIYTDFAQPHRSAIVNIIEHAGAITPPKARIPDLVEIAALALRSEPTLLLIDNVDQASAKGLSTIPRLMNSAQAVALAANAPQTPPEHRKIDPLLPRCEIEELKPLPYDTARDLLWQNLDRETVRNPGATERKVLGEADGNPKTIVSLAQRIKRGDARELRTVYSPVKRVNLSWLVLVVIISFAMIARWQVDSYTVAGLLFALALVLRPLLYRSMRSDQ
jgi:hypothetical protein